MTETKSGYRCETCSNNNLELCPFQKWKGIDRPENDMSILMRNNIISAVGCLSHSTIAKWNPTYQDLVDHIRWTQNLWRHGIEIMRKNNLVIASDTPMEKLAFTFYSDLCEIDSRAQHLFAEGPGDEDYKDQSAIRAQGIVPYPRPYEEAIVQTERDRILDILIPLLPEKQFARLDGELRTLRLKEFAEGLRSIPPVPSNKVETEKKDGD
jgi:hypothetical protein